jgi:hypothetical protein
MMLKYFTFLAAVAVTVSSAVGQVSSAPEKSALQSTEAVQPQAVQFPGVQLAPMRRAGVAPKVDNGTASSYNWGGYAVTGKAFTNATASWTVPTVDCAASPNAWVSLWVGIDGYSDSTVEQTGTLTWCDHKTAVYYAWYEFYPSATTIISSITVSPGDVMTAQVSYSSSTTEFTTTLTDVTTGATYSTSQAVSGAERTSAEWIVEAPDLVTGYSNLGAFGKAYFGDDYTSQAGTNEATDSTISGVIKKFGTAVEKITQVDATDFTEQTPSPLSTDGSSFYTAWIEYN